jgi:hypothetical protein
MTPGRPGLPFAIAIQGRRAVEARRPIGHAPGGGATARARGGGVVVVVVVVKP